MLYLFRVLDPTQHMPHTNEIEKKRHVSYVRVSTNIRGPPVVKDFELVYDRIFHTELLNVLHPLDVLI